VVSVEMFEHLKNYESLFERISNWLKPEGKLFVHIFTHREYSYMFETEGEHNWMGKYFFTGGQMPGHSLFHYFQRDLLIEKQWAWSGVHYQKTADAWLKLMDSHSTQVDKILIQVYGEDQAGLWKNRWRVFFMSCAELFGYSNGSEWGVSHYLFSNRNHGNGNAKGDCNE
jgi:cyclopropane-fatty-acyl-phospholipid synthase